jgi:DNA-binding transcriptional regulator YdaS (Cro superfamily)
MQAIRQYMEKHSLSQKSFAELVCVTQSMVSQWISGERPISAERAIIIEERTRGGIKRHQLRPDIFGKRAA